MSVRPLWIKVETLRGSFGMRSLPLRFWDGCFGRYPSAEPFEPLFSEIYGTVTLENRAAECSVTAHLAGFGKCCSGFVHRKILTRWFLCLFVCLFVRMFAWCQFILNLNLPATANSTGTMISYHMPELVNFMATTLCCLIGWNWIMTKAVKSHITGFNLPHRTITQTRLKTKKNISYLQR